MSAFEVGALGQQTDVVNSGDPSGRLLSVAEIQQAFHDLIRGRSGPQPPAPRPAPAAPHTSRDPYEPGHHVLEKAQGLSPHTSSDPDEDPPAVCPPTSQERAQAARVVGGRVGRDWIVVIAAHAGAGASCAALAVADALSAAGRPCRLIETAAPTRSGLVAAATVELGLDASGAWRRGSRGQSTLYRRAHHTAPRGWPEQSPAESVTTVIDAGLPSPDNLVRLAENRPTVVVTCRSTIPGVRMAEHMLAAVGDAPAVVVAIGRARWPGDVTASVGRRLRRVKDDDRVICMPADRRLQVVGLTNSALPKSVAKAGRTVLRLIDDRTGEGTTTRSSSRRKERSR